MMKTNFRQRIQERYSRFVQYKRKHFTLDKRFFVSVLVITLIPMLLIEIYSYNAISKKEIESTTERNILLATSHINYGINNISNVIDNLSNLDDMKEILLEGESQESLYSDLSTQAKIGYILSNYLHLQEALFLDVFSVSGKHYHVGDILSKDAINSARIEELHENTLKMNGAIYWSPIIHNYYVTSSTQYIVTVCSMITYFDPDTLQEKEVGFIILGFDPNNFAYINEYDAKNKSNIQLIDQNYKVIYSENKNEIGHLMNSTIENSLKTESFVRYSENGETFIVAASEIENTPWIAVMYVPIVSILGNVYDLSNTLLIAFIITFIVLFIYYSNFSKKYIVPIRKLTQHFKEYNKGLPLRPLKRRRRTYEEIGNLITWFNQYIKDLEAKDRTEKKLAESLIQQRQVIKGISEVIIQFSTAGEVLFLNPAWEHITGYKLKDCIGKKFLTFVYEDDKEKFFSAFQDTVDTKSKVANYTIRIVRSDGTVCWIEIHLNSMKFSKRIYVVGVFSDITQKMNIAKMKDEFISTVSHELRTPLTAIKESLHLVMDPCTGNLDKMHENLLNITTRNIDRLSVLINNVLDYQKYQAETQKVQLRKLNLNTIILDLVNLMQPVANARKNKITLNLKEDLSLVLGNNDAVMQICINLMNNAIKFTENGCITITTNCDDQYAYVTFKDTGLGIKEEDISKLFQTFSQASNAKNSEFVGSGLGLAICKKIIDNHSGEIWVKSKYGEGSEFGFKLPISP